MLSVDTKDPRPIWRQLEEGVRYLVARGELTAGGVVPSVRELARSASVNPATVAKAYRRLVDSGVLEVRRGEGTFVSATPPVLGEARTRELLEAARVFAARAATLGADRREAEALVSQAFREFKERAHV